MTFKRTQCCALYWALIWLHADAGLYLAVCLILICYIKQHSNSKKTWLSESRRCLLWWSPTEHIGQHSKLSLVLFQAPNQKHLSAVRGATENNFCETETDVCSGYRTWGDISSHCLFTSFQFFHFLKWDLTESRQHREHPATYCSRHQVKACGKMLLQCWKATHHLNDWAVIALGPHCLEP